MTPMTATFRRIALGSLLGVFSSGCITIAPDQSPATSWKSLTKPKVERASFEEKVDEIPQAPKNPARLKMAYGQLMEENGQYAEARKNYSDVIELQPKNVEAILGLARIDQISGNVDQAEQGFRRAAKLDSSSAAAQFGLGQFYASQKRWKESSQALTKAMLAAPDETRYRYALAVSLVHAGDVDSALPHFIRTIGEAEAHYNVGLILQEEGRWSDAERQFTLAVAKKPDLTAAQNWLAHLRAQHPQSIPPTDAAPTDSPVIPAGHVATPQVASLPDFREAPPPAETHAFLSPLTSQQQQQAANQAPLAR